MKKIFIISGLALIILAACNKEFLDKKPLAVANAANLTDESGISALLIGAYSLLDGSSDQSGYYDDSAGPDAWVFSDLAGGNSYKGSDPGDDQELLSLETFSFNSGTTKLAAKWQSDYEGISRSNVTINAANSSKLITPAQKTEILAEARFLRGFYHFNLKKVFGNIPFIDETVTSGAVTNTVDAYPKIEADFVFAAANLPATQSDKGRPTIDAANALLARVYLYEKKYALALPILTAIINGGHWSLEPNFYDDFNAEKRGNQEEIFQVQYSVNDGITTTNSNGNYGDVLNYPYNPGSPVGCCGFNQPSQNLVNAFKTDPVTGLPLFTTYNNSDFKNDYGIQSSAAFTPDRTTPVDPRLDWTVGRRGIPYLDWGNDPGAAWVRSSIEAFGPYLPKKNMYKKSQAASLAEQSGWTTAPNALNYSVVRFADILLMAAECEVEVGSLANAMKYVNLVRARAAASPVYQRKADNSADSTALAANYFVGQYAAFPSQDYARTAVHFEERLEFAMEGHWFFDLVRWGQAATFLNTIYFPVESVKRTVLAGAKFTPGKNEYFAIPQSQIDITTVNGKATLVQNPGY